MDRRTDLDWLRIIAFGLLILYHVGVFYGPYPWHSNSIHAGPAIEPFLSITSPWRLLLLFVISGVATRFMMDKMSSGAFVASRSIRLLPPLVFGMLVIVPPQTWMRLVEHLDYSGSFLSFYWRDITGTGQWVIRGHQQITPEWNHLWFVAYLFAFTLAAIPIGMLIRRLPARWMAPLARWPFVVLLPWTFLAMMAIYVEPMFRSEEHVFVNDFFYLVIYFAAFILGYGVAKHEAFFVQCERLRWWMLGAAVAAYILPEAKSILGIYDFAKVDIALHELQAWGAIVAAFGFARRYLRRDGPVRRYLTDAIFPYYIVHQTVIIVAGHYLTRLAFPAWVEAPMLIAITALVCAATYEIVRRVAFLRPLFGLKMTARKPAPVVPAPQAA